MTRWAAPAAYAQYAYALAAFVLAGYILESGINEISVLTALRSFLAGLVAVWWGRVLARYLGGQPTPDTDGTLRALRAFFPWVTALRLSLWLLLMLVLSGNTEANSVTITAMLTITLGYALAKNAVYGTLARYAEDPASTAGQNKLFDWLNLAAPLAFALGVVNLVPARGIAGASDGFEYALYGLHAAADFVSLLAALWAVRERLRRTAE